MSKSELWCHKEYNGWLQTLFINDYHWVQKLAVWHWCSAGALLNSFIYFFSVELTWKNKKIILPLILALCYNTLILTWYWLLVAFQLRNWNTLATGNKGY